MLHSSAAGQRLLRQCVQLSWWIHDMVDRVAREAPAEAKFHSLECDICEHEELFEDGYKVYAAHPEVCIPKDDLHQFFYCINHTIRRIIMVFRSTVSGKCWADVWTDLNIRADHFTNYEGAQHCGFAKRAQSIPVQQTLHYAKQGYEIIITGHSLGGAVAQLYTARVLDALILQKGRAESRQFKVRCITFGNPQVADSRFWEHLAEDWWDYFDSYIYGNDVVFRLEPAAVKAAGTLLQWLKVAIKAYAEVHILAATGQPSLASAAGSAIDAISDFLQENLVPCYSLFGRQHFMPTEAGKSPISVGRGWNSEDSKQLRTEKWPILLQKAVPFFLTTYKLRDFIDHGCYPMHVTLLGTKDAKLASPAKPHLMLPASMSESLNLRGKVVQGAAPPYYLTIQGHCVDFIRKISLHSDLFAEGKGIIDVQPSNALVSSDSPQCVVLLDSTTQASAYLSSHPKILNVKVSLCFAECHVDVAVQARQLVPALLAERLDADGVLRSVYWDILFSSAKLLETGQPMRAMMDEIQLLFNQLAAVGNHGTDNVTDEIISIYLAHLCCLGHSQASYMRDQLFDCMPTGVSDLQSFLETQYNLLNQVAPNDAVNVGQMQRVAAGIEMLLKIAEKEASRSILPAASISLTSVGKPLERMPAEDKAKIFRTALKDVTVGKAPLFTAFEVDFAVLRATLNRLQGEEQPEEISRLLPRVLVPLCFCQVKIHRMLLRSFSRDAFAKYSKEMKDMVQRLATVSPTTKLPVNVLKASWWVVVGSLGGLAAPFILPVIAVSGFSAMNEHSLLSCSSVLLSSMHEKFDAKELKEYSHADTWLLLQQVQSNVALNERSAFLEDDTTWRDVFKNNPLHSLESKYRGDWIKMIRSIISICHLRTKVLCLSRPKVLLAGLVQAGKSHLYNKLTGIDKPETTDVAKHIHTRFPSQTNTTFTADGKQYEVDVIDTPGIDDGVGTGFAIVDALLPRALLVVCVCGLERIDTNYGITLLKHCLLHSTGLVLVLINKVDDNLLDKVLELRKQAYGGLQQQNTVQRRNAGAGHRLDPSLYLRGFRASAHLREVYEQQVLPGTVRQLAADPMLIPHLGRLRFELAIVLPEKNEEKLQAYADLDQDFINGPGKAYCTAEDVVDGFLVSALNNRQLPPSRYSQAQAWVNSSSSSASAPAMRGVHLM